MKKNIRKPEWSTVLVIAALLLTVVLESLSRQSLTGGFQFAFTHPWRFLFNALIVLDTLTLSAFFRRRLFVFCTIALAWLTCGVANCVMVGFRTLPFTIIDLTLLKDAIKLFDVYFNLPQRILICASGVLLVALIAFLFIKAPRLPRINLRRPAAGALMLATLSIACTNLGMNTQSLTLSLGNLTSAYRDYGFAYCFLVTFVDVGIDRPEDYSEQAIEEIQEQIDSVSSGIRESYLIQPNVIFVQLESFFDPKHITALEAKEDPVPTFTRLKNDYPSGYLTMPSIGGGTANSEFEVLYSFLDKLPGILKSGGRAAILTFHSGEDRLVKKAFKQQLKEGVYSAISEEVTRPSAEECSRNPRARSTKLRWAIRA